MKPEKMKVAVLAGGVSGEREISQRSGAAVAKALRSMGVRLVEVDVKSRQVEVPAGTDICFLCLHGSYGEANGTLRENLIKVNGTLRDSLGKAQGKFRES